MNRILFCLLTVIFIYSCGNKSTTDTESNEIIETTGDAAPDMALSMGHNVSVRESPSSKGKRITSISIGEQVQFLDSSVVDEASKQKFEYQLVKLSDGTEGWAVGSYLHADAYLGTTSRSTTIYERPDLMTMTDKKLEGLDVVAVIEKNGEWANVVGRTAGKSGSKTGWIKWENVEIGETETLLAQMTYSALDQKGQTRTDLIDDIYDNVTLRNSMLFPLLDQKLAFDPDKLLKEEYYIIYEKAIDSLQEGYQYGMRTEYEEGVTVRGKWLQPLRYGVQFYLESFLFGIAEGLDSDPKEEDEYEYDWMERSVEKHAGVPMYLPSNPEIDDYSHINPEFVSWIYNNMLPAPDNDFLGVEIDKIYDTVFLERVRSLWINHSMITDQYDLEDLANRYEESLDIYGNGAWTWLNETFDDTGIDPVDAGTIIRRNLDGSYNEMMRLMKKTLVLYDNEWYQEQINPID